MILSENLSERILSIKAKEHTAASLRNEQLRNQIIRRIRQENPGMAPGRVYALGFAAYLAEKDIYVFEEELLAGHIQKSSYSESLPLEDTAGHSGTGYRMDREIEAYKTTPEATPEGEAVLEEFHTYARMGFYGRWGAGHVLPGFANMLNTGLGELIRQARKYASPDGTGSTADALIALLGVQVYFRRYAALARETAETARECNKASLYRIADACENLVENRPSSFFEAIQLLWLTHELIISESQSGSLSVGRVDQMLYPFYKADMEKTDISGEAQELMDALFLKFGNYIEGYQNVCLGGMTPEGESGYNDLSYMGLRSCRLLRQDQPLVVVRCNQMMPDSFWEEVLRLIECGMGFPALFNDDIVIPSKLKMGISLEDARDYAAVGCVEVSVGGKEYNNTESLRINWGKILEALLFNGSCPGAGTEVRLSRDYSDTVFETFEELFEAYKNELVHFTRLGMAGNDILDLNYGKHWPAPFMSSIEVGCLEKNIDITAGGAVYNNSAVNSCAVANTVNSLLALKQVVFEKKLASLEQVLDAMRRNFEGCEILRQQLMNADKFGNDAALTQSITRELTDCFNDTVTSQKCVRGGVYTIGYYTVANHVWMGTQTGAMPDGRLAGAAFASSFSPVQGSEVNGPTEVIKSIACVDHTYFGNGMVLDMKFTPTFFHAHGHRQAFKQMVDAYFMMGGMEIQFNVVSRETLIAAQQNPKDYQNLIVRVSGFSAYFCTLSKIVQDEIIMRTSFEGV